MAHRSRTHPLKVLLIILLAALGHRLLATAYGEGEEAAAAENSAKQKRKLLTAERDFRWPNGQLNVLIDLRSLNETERQILAAVFDQIEHKTCIKVKRLSPEIVNPFDNNRLRWLPEQERNFIYIFKAQFGLAVRSDHPPLGLSSFGCVNQGRQSMVLGELAFRWPDLVLKYHILRSLGLANLVRPDQEVRQRLNVLPLSQKIEGASRRSHPSESSGLDPAPALFAYATFVNLASSNTTKSARQTIVPVKYLTNEDLNSIKQLYNCSDYEQRLSMKPINELDGPKFDERLQDGGRLAAEADLYSSSSNEGEKLHDTTTTPPEDSNEITTTQASVYHHHSQLIDDVTDRMRQPPKINETIIDDAAKSIIMNQLLANDNTPGQESRVTPTTTFSSISGSGIDGNLMGNNKGGKLDMAINESGTTPMPLGGQCKPLESCPIDSIEPQQLSDGDAKTPATTTDNPNQATVPPLDQGIPPSGSQQEEMKPIMLKMDEFQAQDPQLQQANQMKLSQLNNGTIETYRLMNSADFTPIMMQQQQQQQQQFLLPPQLLPTTPAAASGSSSSSKSEMLISFEQSTNSPPGQSNDPVATLASSQVLKLCSCTCQTMGPVQPSSQPQPLPTAAPAKPTTACPTTHDPWPPAPSPTSNQPPPTTLPQSDEPIITTSPMPPVPTKRTTTTEPKTTTTSTATSMQPTQTEPTGTSLPNVTSSSDDTTTMATLDPMPTTTTGTTPSPTTKQNGSGGGGGSMADNPCEQVQWVKPNKTVYASAKIVWDVDRANQNYFLCQNQINNDGDLIPGKTHGFSCKVGSEGRAYEMHNFNVLTKPESVNLAWIQRTSGSLGKTNLPVIGGYSKTQDPLVVSRCLVRDENNDIITLIGYINTLGVGLFPFDDIQIECSQYDVLACVS